MFSNSSFTLIEQRILDVVILMQRPAGLSRLPADSDLRISFSDHRDLLSAGVVPVAGELVEFDGRRLVGVSSGMESLSEIFE